MRAHSLGFVALSLSISACVARTPEATGDSGSTGDTTTGNDTSASTSATTSATSASTSATTMPGTSVGTTPVDTSEVTTQPDTTETFAFIAAPDFGDEPTDLPDGSECESAAQCESGFCRDAPGPGDGVCSECTMDSDCDKGTCSFEFDVGWSVCTDGGVGEGCDSDEGCAGALVCVPAFGDGGPLRCSECSVDLPCEKGMVCSPVFGDSTFQSWLGCVAPGSVPLGGGCPVFDGVGDPTPCESGACGIETFMMGNLELGICSECDGDDDCAELQVCMPPEVDMGGITPGACG